MEMYQKQPTATDVKDDPEARELLRQAFERTARWPADFKGFTADLTINVDGKETGGTVTVKSAQDVVVSLPDPELQKWATNTIGMIAVHRGPAPSINQTEKARSHWNVMMPIPWARPCIYTTTSNPITGLKTTA